MCVYVYICMCRRYKTSTINNKKKSDRLSDVTLESNVRID